MKLKSSSLAGGRLERVTAADLRPGKPQFQTPETASRRAAAMGSAADRGWPAANAGEPRRPRRFLLIELIDRDFHPARSLFAPRTKWRSQCIPIVMLDVTSYAKHNQRIGVYAYTGVAIKTWACNETKAIFEGESPDLVPRNVLRRANAKLLVLHAAVAMRDLMIPPSNRLEKLRGDRAGQHSIRINHQYRICFEWRNGDAYDVEIVDYH